MKANQISEKRAVAIFGLVLAFVLAVSAVGWACTSQGGTINSTTPTSPAQGQPFEFRASMPTDQPEILYFTQNANAVCHHSTQIGSGTGAADILVGGSDNVVGEGVIPVNASDGPARLCLFDQTFWYSADYTIAVA